MGRRMSPPENRNPARRRPRSNKNKKQRRKPGQPSPAAPIRALARNKATLGDKHADEPLTRAEAEQMKAHFKFLRAHKKILKLRLNATEDLLLNGVREPTHRGVCQHLLGKVEKDRVLTVSERLPAPEAAKLLAGVLGFAPEVSFVLRYLECIRGSASNAEAAAALSQALRQIRFDETSNAQMRQVLSLIVGIFPRGELPVLVFNWLFNAAFREAVDRSSEELPGGIAELVRPLRSIHAELTPRGGRGSRRPRPQQTSAETAVGVRLLLGSARPSLLALPEGVRMRLLELGLSAPDLGEAELTGLRALFEAASFQKPAEQARVALSVVGCLLAAGDEASALRLLSEDRFEGAAEAEARRWRRALAEPRIGPVAIEERARERHARGQLDSGKDRERLPPHRWLPGFHIPTQRRVRLRYGMAEDRAEYLRQLELWQSVLLPGVARPVATDTEGEVPYIAVPRLERSLRRALEEGSDQRQIGVQICELLNALALSRVCLPDASVNRFSVDEAGRVWLVDLWDAAKATPEAAAENHAEYARELVPPLAEHHAAAGAEQRSTLLELARSLERQHVDEVP